MNYYELIIRCKCPVDTRVTDVYRLMLKSEEVLKVEDISRVVDEETRDPDFQERLTARIGRRLVCSAATVGVHSGVLVTSVYGELP